MPAVRRNRLSDLCESELDRAYLDSAPRPRYLPWIGLWVARTALQRCRGGFGMQFLAPDILEEARTLSPFLSGAGVAIGFLLWMLGGRTHRFWLALTVTLAAGLLGLALGRDYGMQPLVAGLLLAVSA